MGMNVGAELSGGVVASPPRPGWTWQDFDMVQLVILSLFLFSATFYPLDLYPPVIRAITRISPLYHGVELTRGFMLGVVDWSMLGRAGFLLGIGLGGVSITRPPPAEAPLSFRQTAGTAFGPSGPAPAVRSADIVPPGLGAWRAE